MNNPTLLLSTMRACREYTALTDALAASRRRAVQRPICVNGLCEGAAPLFLTALTSDETDASRRVLLLYSSDRAAADAAMRLSDIDIPAYHFLYGTISFTTPLPLVTMSTGGFLCCLPFYLLMRLW